MTEQAQVTQQENARNTTLNQISLEIENFIRDLVTAWGYLAQGEKLSAVGGVALIMTLFLPWISFAPGEYHFGLMSGGSAHLLLSALVISLQAKAVYIRRKHIEGSVSEQILLRRNALHTLLCGTGMSLISLSFLLYFAQFTKEPPFFFEIYFGFYASLLSSITISTGSILFFVDS